MKIAYHLSFFYDETRFGFLNRKIEEINKYPYETDMFIHTNQVFPLTQLAKPTNGTIHIIGHDLSAPGIDKYHLTWLHRSLMKTQKDSYDVFMYMEDDVLVPVEAINYWLAHKDILNPTYNVGFIRVEIADGQEYMTEIIDDQCHSTQFTKAMQLHDKLYIINDINPYCALFIYDKKEFTTFMNSPFWNPENVKGYGYSESATIGMNGIRDPLMKRYESTLIPVEGDTLHPGCRIYHMTNRFVSMPSCFFASLLFSEAICWTPDHYRHPQMVIDRKHARLFGQS